MSTPSSARAPIAADRVRLPLTRGDCVDGPRPCPHLTCRYHLFESFTRRGGAEIVGGQPKESCALDVADAGGVTLEEVGELLGVGRERARQIEEKAIRKIKARADRRAFSALADLSESIGEGEHTSPLGAIVDDESGYAGGAAKPDRDPDEPIGPRRFADAQSTDESDCDRIWRFYDRACRTREAKELGEYLEVRGIPVSPRHARILNFIRGFKSTDGRGPRFLEIADAIGVEGKGETSRAMSARHYCETLRELGVLVWGRTGGVRVVNEEAIGATAPAKVEEVERVETTEDDMDWEATILLSVEHAGATTVKALAEASGARIDLIRNHVDALIKKGKLRRRDDMKVERVPDGEVPAAAEQVEPAPATLPSRRDPPAVEQRPPEVPPTIDKQTAPHDEAEASQREQVVAFCDIDVGRSIDDLVARFGWKNTETARSRLYKMKRDGIVASIGGRWVAASRAPREVQEAIALTDGQRAVFEVLKEAVARGEHPTHNDLVRITGRTGIYDILHSLRAAGLITWTENACSRGKQFEIFDKPYVVSDARAGAFKRQPIAVTSVERPAEPKVADDPITSVRATLDRLQRERDEEIARVTAKYDRQISAARAFIEAFTA